MKRKVYLETSVISYLTARPRASALGELRGQAQFGMGPLSLDGRPPRRSPRMLAAGASARCLPFPAAAMAASVNVKIVVDGEPLPKGTVVTILGRETEPAFVFPPELEAELLESIAQADRGDTLPTDELL